MTPECTGCTHYSSCTSLCKPMEEYSSQDHGPQREQPYEIYSGNHYKDYKDTINEILSNDNAKMSDIRNIESIPIRAITAMLYSNITISDVARLLCISKQTIWFNLREKLNSPQEDIFQHLNSRLKKGKKRS